MNGVGGDSGSSRVLAGQGVPVAGMDDLSIAPELSVLIKNIADALWSHFDRKIETGERNLFDLPGGATMQLEPYIRRIAFYINSSPENLVLATYYIYRINQRHPKMVQTLRVHKLFLTAFVVARKFVEDIPIRNRGLTPVLGVPLYELNALEIEFLKLLDFKTFVSDDAYLRFYHWIHSSVEGG